MANDQFIEFLHALGPAFGGPDTPLTDPLPVFARHRESLIDPSFPNRLRDFGEGVASETDIFRKTLATQGLVWLHRWLVAASQKDPGLRAAAEAARSVAALVESAKNKDSLYLDFIDEFMQVPDADERAVILRHLKILDDPTFADWLKGFVDRAMKRGPASERKRAAVAYGHLERNLAALVPTHPGLTSALLATQDCIKALLADG